MRYILILFVVATLVLVAGWWYVDSRPLEEQVMELPPVQLLATEPEVEAGAPPAEMPPAEARPPAEPASLLPSLGESDAYVRGVAAGLGEGAPYIRWLATDDLLRRGVAIVDNVADGALPSQLLSPLGLKAPPKQQGGIVVANRGGEMYLNPASYSRYDGLVATIASVDAEGLSRIYFMLEPLLDAAYEELGYPGKRFRPRLIAAIDHLRAAPVMESELRLTRPSVAFEFADPDLESLPETYKQLLRMGPVHTRRIQAKLEELRRTLEEGMVAGR